MARDYSYEAFRDLLDQIGEEDIAMETDRRVAPSESICDVLQDPAFRESERENAGFLKRKTAARGMRRRGPHLEKGPKAHQWMGSQEK